jgi:uncharacterized protein (DUF1778 family)
MPNQRTKDRTCVGMWMPHADRKLVERAAALAHRTLTDYSRLATVAQARKDVDRATPRPRRPAHAR